jgi:cytochrome c-type biogenesis protein CcmE
MNLTFQIADVTNDNAQVTAEGGLAAVLHAAVTDPDRSRLSIVYQGPRPDLLNNEAQAIITGQLGADGDFHADELLLQCPSTYQQAVPSQVIGN